MGLDDKIENKAQETAGTVKEGESVLVLGRPTGRKSRPPR